MSYVLASSFSSFFFPCLYNRDPSNFFSHLILSCSFFLTQLSSPSHLNPSSVFLPFPALRFLHSSGRDTLLRLNFPFHHHNLESFSFSFPVFFLRSVHRWRYYMRGGSVLLAFPALSSSSFISSLRISLLLLLFCSSLLFSLCVLGPVFPLSFSLLSFYSLPYLHISYLISSSVTSYFLSYHLSRLVSSFSYCSLLFSKLSPTPLYLSLLFSSFSSSPSFISSFSLPTVPFSSLPLLPPLHLISSPHFPIPLISSISPPADPFPYLSLLFPSIPLLSCTFPAVPLILTPSSLYRPEGSFTPVGSSMRSVSVSASGVSRAEIVFCSASHEVRA